MLLNVLEYLITHKLLCEEVYFKEYGNIGSMDEWIYQTITLKKTPIAIFEHIDFLYKEFNHNIFDITEQLLCEIENAPFVCKYILLWSFKRKIDIYNYEKIWNDDMNSLCLNFQTNILTYIHSIEEKKKLIKSIYPYIDSNKKYVSYIKYFIYTVETIQKINIDKIFSQKYPFMSSDTQHPIVCNVMILNDQRKLKISYKPGIWLDDSFKFNILFLEFCLYNEQNNRIQVTIDKNGFIRYKCKIGQEIFMKHICKFLNLDIKKEMKSDYVISAQFKIKNKWKRHLFSDLITNHDYLSRIISVYEKRKPLHQRKYLNIQILKSLCTIRESIESNEIIVRTCKGVGCIDTDFIFSIIQLALDIYDEKYKYLESLYIDIESLFPVSHNERTISKNRHRIYEVRRINPELFVHNYSREAMIPKIVTEKEVESLLEKGTSVIKYPKENTNMSFYYTIEESGYYVGLKLNRLSNKKQFPFIVTGYKTNHLKRPGSITYKYYYPDIILNRDNKKIKTMIYEEEELPLPKYLETFLGYRRIRRVKNHSFLQLISFIFKYDYSLLISKLKEEKIQLNLCKQELPNKSYFEIIKLIDQDRDTDKLYRLIEEIFNCNILILLYNSSVSKIFDIPNTRFSYIWNIIKANTVILIKTYKVIYSEEICIFDYIRYKEDAIFDFSNPLCEKLINEKKQITDRGIDSAPQSIFQYLDSYGRCVQTYSKKNGWTLCRSQPLNLEPKKRNLSNIEIHTHKMNYIKKNNNIPRSRWNSSNRYFYYFPNKDSFLKWKT